MKVIILRGLPGSGKSELARWLISPVERSSICCTDDFFYDKEGTYCFDRSRSQEAHMATYEKFLQCLQQKLDLIIVDNTNTQEWEFTRYVEAAQQAHYEVACVIVETRFSSGNIHNVPWDVIETMRERFEIKL